MRKGTGAAMDGRGPGGERSGGGGGARGLAPGALALAFGWAMLSASGCSVGRLGIFGIATPAASPTPQVAVFNPSPASPDMAAGGGADAADPPPRLSSSGFLFYEDFEKGEPTVPTRWAYDPGQPVGWRLLKAPSCGGLYTMLMGRDAQAELDASAGDSVLQLKAPLDLQKAKKPTLKFDVKGQSTPAEAITLTVEVRAAGADWRAVGKPVTGRYPLAVTRYADLTPFAGGKPELRFRVHFDTPAANTSGLLLDDVQVLEAL